MTSTTQLRLRFLAALSGSVTLGGAVPLACSGGAKSTDATHPSGTSRAAQTGRPEVASPHAASPSAVPPSTVPPRTPVAVGTRTAAEPQVATKDALKPSCGTRRGEVECFAPGSTHFNAGNVPDPVPPPKATFDGNRCQVRAEVRDGCCNAARSGPELIDGQCCYGFCTGACCGRPLLVGGVARIAPVCQRDDWCDELDPDMTGLGERERRELSRLWLADARLEHASIASFARFALDLLAFGAPAELVEGCQRAMADEIEHARACFALASAYAGAALGPGALDLSGVAVSPNLAAAAAAAVREGCLNETVAALIADEQARAATDPAPRAVLERIARDEAEHAELAWRFVSWAVQVGGPTVSSAIATALEPPRLQSEVAIAEPDLRAYGRISAGQSATVARAAWREVVLPCARAFGVLHSIA